VAEEVVLALEVVIDKGFRDIGLMGYLEGGGAFKTLFGEKVGSRLNNVLSLAQNALTRFMGGHEITDILKQILLKII
jgi:hypothetical protein